VQKAKKGKQPGEEKNTGPKQRVVPTKNQPPKKPTAPGGGVIGRGLTEGQLLDPDRSSESPHMCNGRQPAPGGEHRNQTERDNMRKRSDRPRVESSQPGMEKNTATTRGKNGTKRRGRERRKGQRNNGPGKLTEKRERNLH